MYRIRCGREGAEGLRKEACKLRTNVGGQWSLRRVWPAPSYVLEWEERQTSLLSGKKSKACPLLLLFKIEMGEQEWAHSQVLWLSYHSNDQSRCT